MDSLSGLYQLLDARVSTFPRLCRLQGRLDLLLSQALPSAEAASGMGEGGMLGLTTPLVTVTVGGIQLCVHMCDILWWSFPCLPCSLFSLC